MISKYFCPLNLKKQLSSQYYNIVGSGGDKCQFVCIFTIPFLCHYSSILQKAVRRYQEMSSAIYFRRFWRKTERAKISKFRGFWPTVPKWGWPIIVEYVHSLYFDIPNSNIVSNRHSKKISFESATYEKKSNSAPPVSPYWSYYMGLWSPLDWFVSGSPAR